ncbi:MAG TPA: ferrous iron transporter B, partial [Firmicutes bacterium]|nr:ferrous iron transporter B [Bacillota bacterium]
MNEIVSRSLPIIAIAGNPNSGKTALFNAITGARQHVGNWPGVTVEKKEGRIARGGKSALVVDLPGTYSLGSQALDETIARDFIMRERPDVVINVVDSTNLERNLYLTIQLLDMGVPIVMALNIFDEAEALGIHIDVEALSKDLGVTVVPTVAVRSQGIDELLDAAFAAVSAHSGEDGSGQRAEQDSPGELALALATAQATPVIEQRDQAAERRYQLASEIAQSVITTSPDSAAESPSQRIDRVALNRWLAYPIFFGVVWAMFQFTFTLSEPLANWLGSAIGAFGAWAEHTLAAAGAPDMVVAFLVDGVIAGLGAL